MRQLKTDKIAQYNGKDFDALITLLLGLLGIILPCDELMNHLTVQLYVENQRIL